LDTITTTLRGAVVNSIERSKKLLEKFNPDAIKLIYDNVHPVFPDLVEKLVSDIYDFAYARSGIDLKTRHLITLGVISAMGDSENQLRFQSRAALNLGITAEEIREVFIQVAVFAGNTRAYNAARIFKIVVDEIAAEK
jgi:4-carboxymuconolactone decarboxylase